MNWFRIMDYENELVLDLMLSHREINEFYYYIIFANIPRLLCAKIYVLQIRKKATGSIMSNILRFTNIDFYQRKI